MELIGIVKLGSYSECGLMGCSVHVLLELVDVLPLLLKLLLDG
jgi:hypothetical protein